MAFDVNDLMALKSLESGMSPYEQVKVGHMQSRRPSGVGIAGLVLGTVGAAAAIGAWIFGPTYAKSQADRARDVANARYDANQTQLGLLTNLLATERAERVAGDINLTNTVTDSQTGSQASQLTAAQQAELAASQATQQVMMQTFSDAVTGKSSLNPTPVMIYSAPQPCNCPGCGCNG